VTCGTEVVAPVKPRPDEVSNGASRRIRNPSGAIRTFAAASFLNDMGSDMIYPVWPLFVRDTLGASMTALGLLDGLGDAVVSLSQAGSGYLSDRLQKRKVFIWIGYAMGALSRVGYSLSRTWAAVVPFRILDRAGKIRSAPRDAIIADLSTAQNRGANFGLLRTADNFGAVAGILACLALVEVFSLSTIFLIAALPSAIGAAAVFLCIRDRPAAAVHAFKGIRLKHLSVDFRRFLIVSAIFSLGAFSYSFLLLYARDSGLAATSLPLFYLVFTLVAALSSYPAGRLADRLGRKPMIGVGFALWLLVCLGFLLAQSALAIGFLFALYGLHRGVMETVSKVFVAELCPPELRASSLGGYQMVIGLCSLPASFLAGGLWDAFGREAPMGLAILLTAVALGLLITVKETRDEGGQ